VAFIAPQLNAPPRPRRTLALTEIKNGDPGGVL
jgi:hypothetical protein